MLGSLAFVGHVSMDRIENINGVREQPGGSALYSAVAARTLLDDVKLVTVVGRDFKYVDVLRLFDLRYTKVYNMTSTRFHIRYDERWEARYEDFKYGAGSKIRYSMIDSELIKEGGTIHLSPMRAPKVAKMIDKIRSSGKTVVSMNTWIGYILESRRSREILRDLTSKVDFFILNDAEAKALAQTDSIPSALSSLKAKRLIITIGDLGAIVSGEDEGRQMMPALHVPSGKVVDTTGAGDTWCGAFLAAYSLTESLIKAITFASIISGIKCSGWGFDNLLKLRFRDPDEAIDYVIGMREGGIQKRIPEYTKHTS